MLQSIISKKMFNCYKNKEKWENKRLHNEERNEIYFSSSRHFFWHFFFEWREILRKFRSSAIAVNFERQDWGEGNCFREMENLWVILSTCLTVNELFQQRHKFDAIHRKQRNHLSRNCANFAHCRCVNGWKVGVWFKDNAVLFFHANWVRESDDLVDSSQRNPERSIKLD